MQQRVSKRELERYVSENGIDVDDKSYEELRSIATIKRCKKCNKEFLYGYTDELCSDSCQTRYIKTHFR